MINAEPDLGRFDECVDAVGRVGFAHIEDTCVQFAALNVHEEEGGAVRVHERSRV